MFESFSNLIFIAILIAISIGRMVMRTRRKTQQPPRPAVSQIPPVHFENREEEEIPEQGHWVRNNIKEKAATATPAVRPRAKARQTNTVPTPSLASSALPSKVDGGPLSSSVRPIPAPRRTTGEGQTGFSLNISHLSPMKQAVIMAEILGPPRGMT